jgi:DNA modification methylase
MAKPQPPFPDDDLTTTIELLDIATLRPHPRNDRIHPPDEIAHLRQSIREHGIYRNVVVAADGTILAGRGVVQAAQEEGRTQVPGQRRPYGPDDPRALKLLVGDNHIADQSRQDDALLAALLQDIAADDPMALLGTGFDEAMLAALLDGQGLEHGTGGDDAGRDVEPQIDRAEELRQEWGVEVGQLWLAGNHRIICGDCTDKAVFTLLLSGATPDIMINDPPYGMRLDADFSSMVSKPQFAHEKAIFGGRRYAKIQGDSDDFDASALRQLTCDIPEQLWFGADYYAASLGDTQHTGSWLVWDKRLDETMDRMYGSCFELIWSQQRHKRDILRHTWTGVFGMEHEPQKKRMHPNQKPIPLLENLLTRYSPAGGLVLDGYAGVGSLLIACERLRYHCRACEIEPAYVAVTLQRYADLTGQIPQRLEG